ncbi:MAG: ribulose-phosphate 3-epimerase [Malacoplasma sp.]|nr:ribulose-phosphate 3-epimerase [Malacoplasma sp.]
MQKIIEFSVLALDQTNKDVFMQQVETCLKANIKHIHYDVMDNVFVNNISFYNLEFLDYLISKGFIISVHLMVKDVKRFVNTLVTKKINAITFHCEAIEIGESQSVINQIQKSNLLGGIAIKPHSDLLRYQSLIKASTKITLMSVEPGFGGQKYIINSETRAVQLRSMCKPNTIIEIDGGINGDTIKLCHHYCDHFVTGSYLFKDLNQLPILQKIINPN